MKKQLSLEGVGRCSVAGSLGEKRLREKNGNERVRQRSLEWARMSSRALSGGLSLLISGRHKWNFSGCRVTVELSLIVSEKKSHHLQLPSP